MKFAAICESGLGSSFMVQMNIQQILKDENIDTSNIEVTHFDVGSASSNAADYFFIGRDLQAQARKLGEDKVVVLNSIIDKKELREKLDKVLDKEHLRG